MRCKLKNNAGVSFLEIMIVIAILGIIAVLVINPFTGFRNSQTLSGTTEEILSALQQARVKTLTAEGGSQYGVHFSNNQVVVFTGVTYNASSPSNQNISLNSILTISSIDLTGGGADIIFQKLTGATSQNGTVVVRLNSDMTQTKTITINSNGISDVN